MRQPYFSIVIPSYGRHRQLTKCLRSVACLEYPPDRFEVIVVDDGNENPLDTVIASCSDQIDTTLITQSNAGPASARNTGAWAAKGDLLAFTDDDCLPIPAWLHALAARFRTAPGAAIGGRTVNALLDNHYSTASELLVGFLYDHYGAEDGSVPFFTSNNLAVPADTFRALGGFDNSFRRAAAEDRDFCDRWLHSGGELAYAPKAIVYHEHRLTLLSFWRQHFSYGRGAFQYHQRRARRVGVRIEVEPLSFYLDLVRYPFDSPREPSDSVVLSALLMISQVANAAGFASEWWSRAVRPEWGCGGRS